MGMCEESKAEQEWGTKMQQVDMNSLQGRLCKEKGGVLRDGRHIQIWYLGYTEEKLLYQIYMAGSAQAFWCPRNWKFNYAH